MGASEAKLETERRKLRLLESVIYRYVPMFSFAPKSPLQRVPRGYDGEVEEEKKEGFRPLIDFGEDIIKSLLNAKNGYYRERILDYLNKAIYYSHNPKY